MKKQGSGNNFPKLSYFGTFWKNDDSLRITKSYLDDRFIDKGDGIFLEPNCFCWYVLALL